MTRAKNNDPRRPRRDDRMTLTDADMTTARVDRRSFLSKAVAAASVAAGAALTAACPGGSGDGTDSDGSSQ